MPPTVPSTPPEEYFKRQSAHDPAQAYLDFSGAIALFQSSVDRLRYLSLGECDRLIAACIAPHLKAIVTVALHTGMRSGEIRNLNWRDLDFDSGFVIIRDSKNGESRHVPMDSTVVDLFRNYPRTPGSDLVFTNAVDGRIGWLQRGFRKALGRAGITDLHFHDLRHTFASQWMMAGGELYSLRDILGHKTIAMTQRYAHLSPAYKRAMVERMEQIWTKPAAQPVLKSPTDSPRKLIRRHQRLTKAAVAISA